MATTRIVNENKGATSRIYATGRRKEASARVWLTAGDGKTTINGREPDEYLRRASLVQLMNQPFEAAGVAGEWNVMATVRGGGLKGQAGAIRHGIARALVEANPDLRTALKSGGFLTRDARTKERKKYGQKGARARFQFSKR
jgi:small subunit ribosomal protein S9